MCVVVSKEEEKKRASLLCIFFHHFEIEIISHSESEELISLSLFSHTQLTDFWCPTKLTDVDGSIKTWELPKGRYDFKLTNSAGLRFEAEETRQLINQGLIESPDVSHEESMRIARVQEKLRKQLGVHFPEDDLEY